MRNPSVGLHFILFLECIAFPLIPLAASGATANEPDTTLQKVAPSGLAELSPILFDEDRLYKTFDYALELTEVGAAYEGARLIATIALKTDYPDLRFKALDYLEEWDLTPEEVLRGNKHVIHQKIIASSDHQAMSGNAFGHVRNLFKLGLIQEAAKILEKDSQTLDQPDFVNKWGILLDEFGIPVEPFCSASESQQLKLIREAYTFNDLKDRLPLIWFLDRRAWNDTRDLLLHGRDDPESKEWTTPTKFGLRKTAVLICLITGSVALIAGVVMLKVGLRQSPWARYGFISAGIVLMGSMASVYYLEVLYDKPYERPYAKWVYDRMDWSEEEEAPRLTKSELVSRVGQFANEFANQSQWKAVKLISEILIFVKGPDTDLEVIESLLLGANQHLDALQNPLHSDERPQPDEAASLLDTNDVHHYELELTKEAIQSLRDDPKTYVKGTFKYKDTLYENVGVKLKGKWGSFRIIQGDSKPAFTIKFNAFTKDQRFFGLKRIILNNAVQDPTFLHEAVGYAFYREAGLVAPRVGHAMLKVNGEVYGLYVQVEAATKEYLKRWFEDPDGDLYEGPGGLMDWEILDLDSNQENEDRTRIRMLYETIMNADPIDPWSGLKEWIDLRAFARFLATEQFINNWDGYPEANNYRLYDDPTTGKFYFFPHGADQSMEDSRHDMFGRNLEDVAGRALIMTQTGRQAYREAIRELLDHAWDSEKILARMRQWYLSIYPFITTGLTPFSENEFEHNVTQIIEFVKWRPFVVRHQLNVDALEADWKHYDEDLPFIEP